MAYRKPPRIAKVENGDIYYILWNDKGTPRRKSLGTTDLQKAENIFAGWLVEYRKDFEIDADPYVGDCLDLWFEQWIKGQMLSENRYPSVVNNLKAYFGRKRVSEVTREHSREYRTIREHTLEIGKGKCSPATTRHELQKLRACFNFMANRVEPKERRVKREIIPYIDLPPPAPSRDRVLTPEELEKLNDFCINPATNKFHYQGGYRKQSNRISKISRFLMLAIETAQRKTAILELKWDQVDLDLNLIQFNPRGRNQTIKKRPAIPMSKNLRSFLEMIKHERISEYVCDSKTDIHYNVSVLAHKLDIPGLSPHVLRHTWITRKVMAGHQIEKVAEYVADDPETIRKHYIHLTPDYLRSVVD